METETRFGVSTVDNGGLNGGLRLAGKLVGGYGLIALLVVYALSGVYTVQQGELGVVRQFGKVVETTDPGLHWHWPWPVEAVDTPKVTEIRRLEIGFRTLKSGNYEDVPEEMAMMTGDENILNFAYIIQYTIKDPVAYLFNTSAVDTEVKLAAQAAMRQVIASHTEAEALTVGKDAIQQEARNLTQQIIDRYGAGVTITAAQLQDVEPPQQVADAFKDVQTAKEEANRAVNEAEANRNQRIPLARGEAAKTVNEAEAYAQARVTKAQGDASSFLAQLQEYRNNPSISRTRLYLETMKQVLPGVDITVIDPKTGGVVPYLPLTKEGK